MARTRIGMLILSLVLGLTSIAPAQQQQPGHPWAPLLFSPAMKKELKLSDEQIGKLKDALGKVMAKFKEDIDKYQKKPPSPEEADKATKAFNNDTWKAVTSVLDAKQSKRFQQILWQMGGIGALEDPDLQKALKLSDEQKKKLAAIFKDGKLKLQKALKEGKASKEKVGALVDALVKEAEDKINALLTDEQKKRLKELKGPPFQFSSPAPPPRKKR